MEIEYPRCPWAIHFGVNLHTRCGLREGHCEIRPGQVVQRLEHTGPGMAQFPEQTVVWYHDDRRQYLTSHDSPNSWEGPPRLSLD